MSTTFNPPVPVRPTPPPLPDAKAVREALAPRVRVYNPLFDTKIVSMFGDDYVFPPGFELAIKDKMRYRSFRDFKPGASPATAWDDPKLQAKDRTAPMVVEASAIDIAMAICDDTQMGKVGFCVLLDDGHDEQRKLNARQKAVDWTFRDSSERERQLTQKVAAWNLNSPGYPYPKFRPHEIRAMQWLERYHKGEFNAYISGNSDEDRAFQAAAADLFAKRNPAVPVVEKPALASLTPEGHDVAPADLSAEPGEQAVGAVLLKEARKRKIKLSAAELEGLIDESEVIIARVARKVKSGG